MMEGVETELRMRDLPCSALRKSGRRFAGQTRDEAGEGGRRERVSSTKERTSFRGGQAETHIVDVMDVLLLVC